MDGRITLSEMLEIERMRMWGRVSPMSNLHGWTCPADCLNPDHYPEGDPLAPDDDGELTGKQAEILR